MPDLEVNVFNQKLKLSYQEDEKQRLIKAVDILNHNWKKFSHLHGKVSDIKIITLISLELQDSIGSIKTIEDKLNSREEKIELLKKKTKNLQLELNTKNEELSRLEKILDDSLAELLEIKNKILK